MLVLQVMERNPRAETDGESTNSEGLLELFRRKMNEAEQINRLKGCGCQKTAAKDGFLGARVTSF